MTLRRAGSPAGRVGPAKLRPCHGPAVERRTRSAGSGRDVVHGFRGAGLDRIVLDGDANLTKGGTRDDAVVGAGKDPGAGEASYHHQGGGTILEGFGGRAHFEVGLDGFTGPLTPGDLIL